jgi:hypothetical protein
MDSNTRNWLLATADIPVCYNLTHQTECADALLQNAEVAAWLARLAERSNANEIGKIHGSHDYRMENILGKCWILGLNRKIQQFDACMGFILEYLIRHIQAPPTDELSFGKLYHYRDCEKVLACFLPLLGYYDNPAVQCISRKRIAVLYEFTKHKSYDIYVDGSKLKGVKKEWQPYIINPDLYADGHIALPDMHDLLLFAGMYPHLEEAQQNKIENIVEWFFGEGYSGILRRYGYFYAPGGSYNAKAILFKLHLLDFQRMDFDKGDLTSLLLNTFVLSHFAVAKKSEWFAGAINYLAQYSGEMGRYVFPPLMLTEKPDSFVIFGGHMNVGENKKNKIYREILSTYWMERIGAKCTPC